MHKRNSGQEAGSAFAYVKEAAGSAFWGDLSGCPSGPLAREKIGQE